jgi:thioredoxin 1
LGWRWNVEIPFSFIDSIDHSHRERMLPSPQVGLKMPDQTKEAHMSDGKNIIAVTDADFEERVLRAEGPVLLKFEAEWCGPCQAMKPAIAELADEYGAKLTIATLDIDQNQRTPYKFGVRGVPTVMLFNKGNIVGQKVGLARKAELVALIDKHAAQVA